LLFDKTGSGSIEAAALIRQLKVLDFEQKEIQDLVGSADCEQTGMITYGGLFAGLKLQ